MAANKKTVRVRSRASVVATVIPLAVGAAAVFTGVVAAAVTVKVALTVIRPVRKRAHPEVILRADLQAGTITLKATPESLMPGRLRLSFGGDDSYALLGPVVRRENNTVIRRLETAYGPSPLRGRARITGNYYTQPEELDIPYRAVSITTELGAAPAWQFPPASPQSDRWVIAIHGWRGTREEPLRAVPIFHRAGYHCLLVSYRNDNDAPESPDHRYRLGGTEWRDVEAAIEYAKEQGARSIILMGWSMGGAIALQTVLRTSHSDLIAGLILESPVIDWVETLRYQAKLMHLPSPVTALAFALLSSSRASALIGLHDGIDFVALDLVARAKELPVPTLLLHSDDDGFVPSGPSRRLADARSDLVTFVPFAEALHTRLWNNDEHKWSEAIRSWLGALETSDSHLSESATRT